MSSTKQKQNQSNQSVDQVTILTRSLTTGFVGGILWSFVASLFYFFNFMEVSPKSFLLTSWVNAGWTDKWLGNFFTVIIAGIVSVVFAFLYYVLLKKVFSLWVSILFGIAVWAIVFFVFQPLFPNVPHITELSLNTWVTTICVFILYGTFVGYSISYNYEDWQKANQPQSESSQ
ncbi:YqhR family membrane protein [Oceanobacillus iheyensis]|uniref:YqhR family membrane protein n=1 Tax=Oceanobacillus iheyensis TaxID=182710 RepID=UPI00363509E1